MDIRNHCSFIWLSVAAGMVLTVVSCGKAASKSDSSSESSKSENATAQISDSSSGNNQAGGASAGNNVLQPQALSKEETIEKSFQEIVNQNHGGFEHAEDLVNEINTRAFALLARYHGSLTSTDDEHGRCILMAESRLPLTKLEGWALPENFSLVEGGMLAVSKLTELKPQNCTAISRTLGNGTDTKVVVSYFSYAY